LSGQTTDWGAAVSGGFVALLFAFCGLLWVRYALRRDPHELSKLHFAFCYGGLLAMAAAGLGAIVVGLAGMLVGW
jgi:hypothetical protein